MKKKILSFLLTVLMLVQCVSVIPAPALAADVEYTGTGTFTQCTGALTSGYYVFGVGSSADSISAVNTTATSNWIKFTTTTSTSGSITNPDTSIVWYYDASAGTFNNGTNYVAWPTTDNSAGLNATGTPLTVTETTTAGVYNITVTATPARVLRLNGTSGYRFYTSSTGTNSFYFFKLDETTLPDASCEHANTEAIGEAKDATCTEAGITAGEKCVDCGAILNAQETLPALGHNYVDGVCSVCDKQQPLTINKGSLIDVNTYGWYKWNAATSTGGVIEGYAYTTNNADAIQVNGSKDGDYIYNTTALPGKIVSITLTSLSGKTDRNFDILTSDTPFDHNTTASLKGQATDAKKIVTTDGVTWTFETNHKYFAIVICDSSAAYLSSIEITYAVCNHTNTTAIGEAKDANCTEDGITAGVKCADCGEVITAQEAIDALGHKDEDNNKVCDECSVALCGDDHTWVDNDEPITAPSCAATGLIGQHCSVCGEPNPTDRVMDKVAHTPKIDEAVDATCIATGLTEGSHCSVCDEVLKEQTEVPMVDHNYVDGTCSVCGDVKVTGSQLADFEFGTDGGSGEGNSAISAGVIETFNGYELNFTTATNVYDEAWDAKGNSALKLGTSSKAGVFEFTVPVNVNTVVIYISGRQAKTVGITVNGTSYDIETLSDDGEYTKVVVDTTENKTVNLTTTTNYRAYVNSIEFWGEEIISGYTVTMGDNIGVNFYMDLIAETLEDSTAYVEFTLPNGTTEKVYVNSVAIETNGYYKFTANIAVKEMADIITAQLITASGNSEEYTYTVKQYAEYIINTDSYSETEKALAKAMLNYGAYAQVMFGYNTGNLANSEIDSPLGDVSIADTYAKTVEGTCAGATYLGTSTMWESDTAIRHYFDITGENITFTLNGTPLEVKDGAYGKYVAIDGIVAKDMSTAYTLTVSNGTDTQTITYSVYSYFYDVINGNYTDAEKNAMRAGYLYAEAATAYLENK